MAPSVYLRFAVCSFMSALSVMGQDTSSPRAGLSKFWTDDYETFKNIYGKTSDHHIYGDSLPRKVVDQGRPKQILNSYQEEVTQTLDTATDGTQVDPFSFIEPMKMMKDKWKLKRRVKPRASAAEYGAINPGLAEDEALSYLKQYQHLAATQSVNFPYGNLGGLKPHANFKPYIKAALSNYESYKNIQDIIEAQDNIDDKDAIYGKPKPEIGYNPFGSDVTIPFKPRSSASKMSKYKQVVPSGSTKSRRIKCKNGVCRKASYGPSKPRSIRPRLRKIKQKIIRYAQE